MSKFVLFRNIHSVVKGYATPSPAYSLLYYFQIHPFSSSSPLNFKNQNSFTINYLINSCGLTPERAVSASKHLKFEAAEKPDAVLTFFRNQGFTQTQISKLILSFPIVLNYNPEKIFLPKIEFFESKGISLPEILTLVSQSPNILAMSLENRLIPSFNMFSTFFNSEEKAVAAFKRVLRARVPSSHVVEYLKPNIDFLRQAGVPMRYIAFFVAHYSSAIVSNCKKFRRVLEEVKKMDFDPQNLNFVIAIKCLLSVTQSTWDGKIKVYKQWGWSDDDLVRAFRKFPFCMNLSEDKMNSILEHLISKMGFKSSFIAQRPIVLSFSLEKRIVPRSLVYQVLVSKGLLKPCHTSLATLFRYSEKRFTERITRDYGNEAPELLNFYRKNLDVAKVKIDSS